jgi:DNA replication protein DnaC
VLVNLEMERIALLADRLHLPQLATALPILAEEAARKEQSYSEFLLRLLEEEVRAADIRAQEMMLRLASFPFRRTLEDFDFSFQPSVSQKQLREFAGCAYVERAENVILLGPPGVGKTHLAVALGLSAIAKRLHVKFTTVAAMVATLSQALKAGSYPARLRTYLRPSVLILDEIGFLPLEAGQASLLFEVISRRYERGSIILTSNKSYGEWAEIFSGDEVIATAMLDRLLHHATTITIKGQSYRLKDKQRAGLVARRKENEENE